MHDGHEQLQGVLSTIKFHQGNFLIGVLDDGTTVKGSMLSPQVGLEYTFRGRREHHPRWGEQFAFTDYRASYPTDLAAIQCYLVDNCKWIGPEIGKRLVNTYGKETLAVCKADPDRVAAAISGITPRRAKEIAAMLRNNEANENLQLALKDLLGGTKVNRRAVNQILEKWGQDALARIRENPYALIEAIDGIGFLTADEVARKIGYDFSGPPRIRAGLIHTLKEQAFGQGHTCLPKAKLLAEAEKILAVPPDRIGSELGPLEKDGLVISADGFVYLKGYHDDEKLIAEKLKVLARQTLPPGQPDFEGLADDQKEALSKAVSSGVFILTGAPGTGKTYTIKRIISSFPEARVALATPTGKAAKRVYEQSGRLALTIHKLLEPQKEGDRFVFTRDAENPVEADLIVLDEVSMVDTPLMARFLEAVAPGTRLILVGDTYQLPSVGPGNILKDLIASGAIPSTELTIIKRQDEGLIIRNCHRIKNGEDIELGNSTVRDFFFLKREDEESMQETILELVSRRFPESYHADPLKEVQVITPLREKTALSCKALNEVFQRRLNPKPKMDGVRFKVGDKVIQTKNQYDLDIINGDIGYVRDIDERDRTITVAFENPERVVQVPLHQNDLELAYAITCHKFQGSEARIIVVPIHRSFGPLIMQRQWLYTAVSRAREVCVLVGQREEVPKIIQRNAPQRRHTRLQELLR
ncbi:MAG: AAA family ATPase [Armatimonadota bacterium]|nr:AAA family ATPase [Armatimonadota bacterium]